MILDGFLIFTGTSQGASGGIASGAQTDAPTTGTQDCSNIVDIGVKSGIPTSANGAGARDLGIGNPDIWLFAEVTTALTGGTSIQLELQGAPDNGSGSPGSYTVMWTGAVVVEADLVAGAQLANVNVPRVIPGQPLPRFLKMTCVSVGTHSAGTIEAGVVLDRFDQIFSPTGTAAGTLSGYPAGLNVANYGEST